MINSLLSWVILVSTIAAQSAPKNIPTPTFFISRTTSCEFNGAFLDAGSGFPQHGSLCAYVEETHLVYACPAPDGICWNAGEPCTGSGRKPGVGQTQCSDIGVNSVKWCCNGISGNCTQNVRQANNCWSWFRNPNREANLNVAAASATRLMLSVTGLPNQNIIVSSFASGGYVAVTTSTTPSSSPSSDSASSPTTNAADLQPQSTNPGSSADNTNNEAGLSGGAIAGVVIGGIIGGIAVGVVGFLIWSRSRKSNKNRHRPLAQYSPGLDPQQLPNTSQQTEYFKQEPSAYGKTIYASPPPNYSSQNGSYVAELNVDQPQRPPVELPSNGSQH